MMPTQTRILEYIAKPRTLLQIAYHCRVWASDALRILRDMEAAGRVTAGSLVINGVHYRAWAATRESLASPVTPESLAGNRSVNRCIVRDETAHHLRNGSGLSYPAIARALGYRSHGSVIEAVRRHEKRLQSAGGLVQ
jgi:chromosomal replication initiation ATPase DnaA